VRRGIARERARARARLAIANRGRVIGAINRRRAPRGRLSKLLSILKQNAFLRFIIARVMTRVRSPRRLSPGRLLLHSPTSLPPPCHLPRLVNDLVEPYRWSDARTNLEPGIDPSITRCRSDKPTNHPAFLGRGRELGTPADRRPIIHPRGTLEGMESPLDPRRGRSAAAPLLVAETDRVSCDVNLKLRERRLFGQDYTGCARLIVCVSISLSGTVKGSSDCDVTIS